ncbi:hypothetical protein PCS70012_02350, partial [Streptococcus pneumoniae PCS70012]
MHQPGQLFAAAIPIGSGAAGWFAISQNPTPQALRQFEDGPPTSEDCQSLVDR